MHYWTCSWYVICNIICIFFLNNQLINEEHSQHCQTYCTYWLFGKAEVNAERKEKGLNWYGTRFSSLLYFRLWFTDVSVVWETLQTNFIMPGMQFEYDEEGGTFFYFLFSLWGLVLIPTTYYFWPRKPVDGKDIACCCLVLVHSCSCVHPSILMIFWLKWWLNDMFSSGKLC